MELFTTREIATGIWILVFILSLLMRKETRKSIIEFLKIVFGGKIRLLWGSFFLYVTAITLLFSRLSFWNNVYLKDIIIWSVTSGVITCMNSVDRTSDDGYIKKVLQENIKPMVIIEILMSTFTFNIIIELFMIPFMAILSMMEAYSENKEEYASVKKLLNALMGIIGIWIMCGTINIALDEFQQLDYSATFISIVIPIVYLIAIIPLLFVWLYFGKYELLFYRMSRFEKDLNIKTKIIKRIRVILLCGLSCNKISRFLRGFSYKSCSSMTENDFYNLLICFSNDKYNDTWYINMTSSE